MIFLWLLRSGARPDGDVVIVLEAAADGGSVEIEILEVPDVGD